MALDRFRPRLAAAVEGLAPHLSSLALDLHRQPEPAGAEVQAVTRLAGELEEEGFAVATGVGGMPTAFRAERGRGGPCLAFLVEYDAIPGLGHACGHNLLCASGIGAAVALARTLHEAPEVAGRIAVVGAPAEETFGGKVVLAARDGFEGIDVALLAHPGRCDRAVVASLASWSFDIVFEGRPAHAVAAPEEGVDALAALVRFFVARERLLQELGGGMLAPGVILEGGVRPNLVPARARGRFSLRAPRAADLVGVLLPRFRALAEELAAETGTRVVLVPVDNLYDELLPNPELAARYAAQLEVLGIAGGDAAPRRPVGSLDVGALSQRIPVLHAEFALAADTPPTHTPAFTACAASPVALRAMLRATAALAQTALELLLDPTALAAVRAAHRPVPVPEAAAAARAALAVPLVGADPDPSGPASDGGASGPA